MKKKLQFLLFSFLIVSLSTSVAQETQKRKNFEVKSNVKNLALTKGLQSRLKEVRGTAKSFQITKELPTLSKDIKIKSSKQLRNAFSTAEAPSAAYKVSPFYNLSLLFNGLDQPAIMYPVNQNIIYQNSSTGSVSHQWSYEDSANGETLYSTDEILSVKYKDIGLYFSPLLTAKSSTGEESTYELPVDIYAGGGAFVWNFTPGWNSKFYITPYDPELADQYAVGYWGYNPEMQFSRFIEVFSEPLMPTLVGEGAMLFAASTANSETEITLNLRAFSVDSNIDIVNDPILSTTKVKIGTPVVDDLYILEFDFGFIDVYPGEYYYIETLGFPQDGTCKFDFAMDLDDRGESNNFFFTLPKSVAESFGYTENSVLSWTQFPGSSAVSVLNYLPYIFVDKEEVNIDAAGGRVTVKVEPLINLNLEGITLSDSWATIENMNIVDNEEEFYYTFDIVVSSALPQSLEGRTLNITLVDMIGLTQTIKVIQGVDTTSGINEETVNNKIKVINKDNVLSLTYDSEIESVEVYSVTGSKVLEVMLPTSGYTEISMDNLSSGIYLLKFNSKKGIQTIKTVKR